MHPRGGLTLGLGVRQDGVRPRQRRVEVAPQQHGQVHVAAHIALAREAVGLGTRDAMVHGLAQLRLAERRALARETPTHVGHRAVGELPPHLAAINASNIACQELAVQAALKADRRLAFYAVALDPLTAAVLSLEEIEQMVDEMFEAEAAWLPQYQKA